MGGRTLAVVIGLASSGTGEAGWCDEGIVLSIEQYAAQFGWLAVACGQVASSEVASTR